MLVSVNPVQFTWIFIQDLCSWEPTQTYQYVDHRDCYYFVHVVITINCRYIYLCEQSYFYNLKLQTLSVINWIYYKKIKFLICYILWFFNHPNQSYMSIIKIYKPWPENNCTQLIKNGNLCNIISPLKRDPYAIVLALQRAALRNLIVYPTHKLQYLIVFPKYP